MSKDQTKKENISNINLEKVKDVKVNFNDINELKDERKKYLTAKYGVHQMSLIRKRLQVENWMLAGLLELCGGCEKEFDEIDIDLDTIIEIGNEDNQKKYLMKKINKPKKPEEVASFIKNLLEKVRTL